MNKTDIFLLSGGVSLILICGLMLGQSNKTFKSNNCFHHLVNTDNGQQFDFKTPSFEGWERNGKLIFWHSGKKHYITNYTKEIKCKGAKNNGSK